MIKQCKVTIFLFGGFGNNLSQINFGKYLEKNGCNVEFDDTLTQKNIFTKLLGWHLHDSTYMSFNLDIKKTNIFSKILIFFILIVCKVKNKSLFNVFYEGSDNLDKVDMNELRRYSYFFGYFQSPKLLEKDIHIKNLLPPANKVLKQIAVHIRGGDFLDKDKLDEQYYLHSINKLKNLTLPYRIFTNDKLLAEKILGKLKIKNFSFSKNSSYMDFNEIRQSKIIISGNSTFSIWSSILSNAEIIFIPKINSNRLLSEHTLNLINKNIHYLDVV